ncbi:thialysine N-epsilon-acetyltransferase [Lepeophtheirus salmonis]|uniref:Spermidine/spermine N1acetyltransferase family member 2 [Trichechus manatus latirostris] n=1 Tax=Lepeophtheirus salmonis TaxID=72036 RepID=A0A0K2UUB4_LEPSM|nr:thialysine N-epsilon-acetyltransferase-like [Lepeophtheirus salmonis]
MIVIRDAVKEDCKALLQLIIELVDYHDMLKNFKITLKMLEENGFGSDATFQCKIAFDDDKPIGHCLYYYGYSSFKGKTVYMENLYVSKSYRNRGIGKLLWKSVCKTALEKGCSSCNFMVDKNNDAAVRFYKFSGAIDKSDVEGWNIFQLSEKGMKEFVNN